jgi:hypothetical protein
VHHLQLQESIMTMKWTSLLFVVGLCSIGLAAAAHADEKRDPSIVAGSSCAGNGQDITAVGKDLTPSGTKVSVTLQWACGCPKGPVHTLVYEPKTSPLRVRICKDQSRDLCEKACQKKVEWDLAQPLKEAGTTKVTFVK